MPLLMILTGIQGDMTRLLNTGRAIRLVIRKEISGKPIRTPRTLDAVSFLQPKKYAVLHTAPDKTRKAAQILRVFAILPNNNSANEITSNAPMTNISVPFGYSCHERLLVCRVTFRPGTRAVSLTLFKPVSQSESHAFPHPWSFPGDGGQGESPDKPIRDEVACALDSRFVQSPPLCFCGSSDSQSFVSSDKLPCSLCRNAPVQSRPPMVTTSR